MLVKCISRSIIDYQLNISRDVSLGHLCQLLIIQSKVVWTLLKIQFEQGHSRFFVWRANKVFKFRKLTKHDVTA